MHRRWFLEGPPGTSAAPRRVLVDGSPFRVGRDLANHLVVDHPSASRWHAELILAPGELAVRDVGSRNGTFVNDARVERAPLAAGDRVRFGAFELQVARGLAPAAGDAPDDGRDDREPPPEDARALDDLLARRKVTVLLQPIVRLTDSKPIAFEALGRGAHPRLDARPLSLLRLAERFGRERELSALFRRRAVLAANRSWRPPRLFLNTHPAELAFPEELLASIVALRREAPRVEMVLELSEAAIVSLDDVARLRVALGQMEVELAFDDFGAGQPRYEVLTAVVPDYLKLDRSMIRDLDRANEAKRGAVASVAALAHALGTRVVAEGIARAEEAASCLALGVDLGQGFFCGEPQPFAGLSGSGPRELERPQTGAG